jgi:hypothetical protein
MSKRAQALAERIERGARELAAFIEGCSEAEWRELCPNEGRTVAVVAHHVASAYAVETDLVKVLASGQPIIGVTEEVVDQANAGHAKAQADCTREETLALLRKNSAIAAQTIRELADEQLDSAALVSLHWDAPLTTQYLIEEHPISHSFRHLASIRAAVKASASA